MKGKRTELKKLKKDLDKRKIFLDQKNAQVDQKILVHHRIVEKRKKKAAEEASQSLQNSRPEMSAGTHVQNGSDQAASEECSTTKEATDERLKQFQRQT
eukprot:TRINITY_DN2454_c0_g1_i1.p1 TRINITY_DN2454_c0_g1~~TRINITY_DN2454_c0_g1_i1.p1  ORF type:complete len:99 (-),score=23.59 TRINITY_DN2454_c0_g1_i1:118-414(-)